MKTRITLLAVSIAGLLIGFSFGFYHRPDPTQTLLRFDHSKHQAIACEVCHRGVSSQNNATVPAQQFCAKCHNTTPDKTPAGAAVWQAAEKGTAWTWPVSYRLPAHVYFSHRRHVAVAQIACQTCHGDMSTRTTPLVKPLKQLVMNDCLACHQSMKVSTDCAHCHR